MERAEGTSLRLDAVGIGGNGRVTPELLPPVELGVRAAIAGTASDLIQNSDGESDVGPLEDPGAYEKEYNKLWAEQHPYPKVGEPVVVDDALMATWAGEEWGDGTTQENHTTDMGDTDSW